MTKVQQLPQLSCKSVDRSSPKNEIKKELEPPKDSRSVVNLLSSPQTHRFDKSEIREHRTHFVQKMEYLNGESVICQGSYIEHNSSISNLVPRKVGSNIEQKGLSRKQATEIRRTVRILHHISPNNKLTLLTLTYGENFPEDIVSKKHLDNFFKRIKRKYYKDKDFHYLWIAEKQERGAIHYHIVLIDYIPIEGVRKAWNGVVSKWQMKEGFQAQEVHPNIKGFKTTTDTKYISNYLSKTFHRIGGYLTKKGKEHTIQAIKGNVWNRAMVTKKACKGKKYRHLADSKEEAIECYNELAYAVETDNEFQCYEHQIKDSNIRILTVRPKEYAYTPSKSPKRKQDKAPEPFKWVLTPVYPNDIETIQSQMVESLWA